MSYRDTCATFLLSTLGYTDAKFWDGAPFVMTPSVDSLSFLWSTLANVQGMFCMRTATLPDIGDIAELEIHNPVYPFMKECQRRARMDKTECYIHIPDKHCHSHAVEIIIAALIVYHDSCTGMEPDDVKCPVFLLHPSGYQFIQEAFLPLDVTYARVGTVTIQKLVDVFSFHATQITVPSLGHS
jgi:hypothetical protein